MIQKLQKFFHTDKWWGKGIFIVLFYTIFWLVFYGIWFLIPDDSFEMNEWFGLLLWIVVIPFVSFKFRKFLLKRNLQISIFLHTCFIIASWLLFFYLLISNIKPNFF